MRKILLPFMTLFLFASCQKETATENIPANITAEEINVCHTDLLAGTSNVISIDLNAWPDHQAHGDVRLDDQDKDGYVPNNACGFSQMGDCDDNNAAINPGTQEICNNGIDENCNGQIDENCSTSVTICSQVWMSKNLEVSNYRNGDVIPQVTDPTAWTGLTTGAWCYYENNAAYGTIYGKLYNWYAVHDARGLAPVGWHVPSDAEWTTLIDYLGGSSVAGGKMKETGTSHWLSPNTGANNSSGFTALPGGLRNGDGPFYAIGTQSDWWSSTEYDILSAKSAWARYQLSITAQVYRGYQVKVHGFSVRCVRD